MDISVKLDVNKAGQFINEPVTMRAGETDNVIKASIFKNNKPYTDFKAATFNTTKLSGAVIANDPATVSGNVISYSVAPTVTNSVGKLRNSYFLLDGKTSTESFEVAILPGVSVGSDISAYIPGLQEFQDEWKKVNSGMTGKLDDIDKSVDTFLAKVQAEIEDKNSKFTDEQKAQITSAISDLKSKVSTSKISIADINSKMANITNSVDALQNKASIGRRNYLLNTGVPTVTIGSNSTNQLSSYTKFSLNRLSDFLRLGESYIIAFDWEITGEDISGKFQPQFSLNPYNSNLGTVNGLSNEKKSGHAVFTKSVEQTEIDSEAAYVRFRCDNLLGTLTVTNLSLRKGIVDSDWSPAPEDSLFSNSNYFDVNDFKVKNEKGYYSFQLLPNTQYTISTDIPMRPQTTNIQDLFIGNNGFSPESNVNGVAINNPLTFITDSTGIVQMWCRIGLDNLYNGNYHIKIEKGNQATKWTPNLSNYQKTKITSDIGEEEQKWLSNGDTGATNLKVKLYGLPKGFHTFYSQAGMINNPVDGEPFRGFFHMTTSDSNGIIGYGYMEGTISDSVYSIHIHNAGVYAANKVIFHKLSYDNTSQIATTAYSAMVQDADTSAVKAQNAQIAYSLMTGDK